MSATLNVPPVNLPEACQTMAEVRAGVDAVDKQLLELLARRFGYMDAAARIKTTRNAVRDEARKKQVIDNVCSEAEKRGLPQDLVAQLWEHLVEGSIAYEFERWDQTRS